MILGLVAGTFVSRTVLPLSGNRGQGEGPKVRLSYCTKPNALLGLNFPQGAIR